MRWLGVAVSFLLLSSPSLAVVHSAPLSIKNPDTLVIARTDGLIPDTVDPARLYWFDSFELVQNVYETLVSFDGECVDKYVPQLASAVPTLENGLIQNVTGQFSPEGLPWYYRYVFPMRTGIGFHNSSLWSDFTLTPRDVEFSIERSMINDYVGAYMFYEPLLNGASAAFINQRTYDSVNNLSDRVAVGRMIDHAVESNATHVWFNLAFPGAYLPLIQILAQPGSSIISKKWVNEYVIGSLGRTGWSGEWGDYTAWINYHNPSASSLDNPTPIMCGTGPYRLETLDYAQKYVSLVKFDDYWRGWPCVLPAPPYPSNQFTNHKPTGFVSRVNVTWAYDWETRKNMFLAGDLDICYVPPQYKDQVLGQPGITCTSGLPQLTVWALFFNFDVSPQTVFGPINDFGQFSENAIPRDFFGNSDWGIHARKAFAYAFDYDAYVSTVYSGEATRPATAIMSGLLYYNPEMPKYVYDLAKAAEEFKQIPSLWETGFTVRVVHDNYDLPKLTMANLLKTGIESINPRFHVIVEAVGWGPTYGQFKRLGYFPTFMSSGICAYPDPNDIVGPFYSGSTAYSASYQKYYNSTVEALIIEGIREADPTLRAGVYRELETAVFEDCPSVPVAQLTCRHFERDWVRGWYYNPADRGLHFCTLWKEYTVPGDVDGNGRVDMRDIALAAQAFGAAYGPPMSAKWNFWCDINNDRKIDIRDIATIAHSFGKTP